MPKTDNRPAKAKKKVSNSQKINPKHQDLLPNNLPQDVKESIQLRMSYRCGPLPSPEELQQYANISEDLLSKIVSMAENEQKHAHEMDFKFTELADKELCEDSRNKKRGQVFALLFSVSSFIASALVFILAPNYVNAWGGTIFAGSGAFGIIRAFLDSGSKIKEEKERVQKESNNSNN